MVARGCLGGASGGCCVRGGVSARSMEHSADGDECAQRREPTRTVGVGAHGLGACLGALREGACRGRLRDAWYFRLLVSYRPLGRARIFGIAHAIHGAREALRRVRHSYGCSVHSDHRCGDSVQDSAPSVTARRRHASADAVDARRSIHNDAALFAAPRRSAAAPTNAGPPRVEGPRFLGMFRTRRLEGPGRAGFHQR